MAPRAGRRALVATALVLAGCAPAVRDGGGQVTAPTTTDSYSVRVGDCLGALPSDTTERLSLLPCDQAHAWEAFATATLEGDDFPGNAGVRNEAEEACTTAFATFVGLPSKKSELELTMLTPTSQTWTQAGDREVVCLVGDPDGGVTGTLAGAGR